MYLNVCMSVVFFCYLHGRPIRWAHCAQDLKYVHMYVSSLSMKAAGLNCS